MKFNRHRKTHRFGIGHFLLLPLLLFHLLIRRSTSPFPHSLRLHSNFQSTRRTPPFLSWISKSKTTLLTSFLSPSHNPKKMKRQWKRQWSSIFHFLLFSVFFQCIYAPGAHKFIGRNGRDLWGRCQPDGRCLGRNEDESRLATALFNGSVGERERISNCMGHCYDADSNCPSCFAQCVDKCVPMPNAASDSGG